MQPFSGYLPEDLAAVSLDWVSPAERQRVIRAYAKHFRIPESDVAAMFDELANNTKSEKNPHGIMPTAQNLHQPDMISVLGRYPTRADQVLSIYDQAVGNVLGGSGQKVPYVRELASPMLAITGVPIDWALNAGRYGYKAIAGEEPPQGFITDTAVPLAVSYAAMGPIQRGLESVASRVPGGTTVLHPWSSFFGSAKVAKVPGLSTVGKLGAGSVVDIGQGIANTGYDIYESTNGKKAKRYTDAVRQTIGYNATPWEAALAHQGKFHTDQVLDHSKAAIQAMLAGKTHGMISLMGGGSRLHTNLNPIAMLWGGYDPLLMGETNKKMLKRSLLPGLKGNIARRKLKYRMRDGLWQGLGKTLAGEYFNHEHDTVDRQIAQERKDFRYMADLYTLAKNPELAFRLGDAEAGSGEEKDLLRERYRWMKDTRVGRKRKSVYDAAADKVGADKSTLA